MKIENVCTKRTYEKNGETKNVWLQVGTLKTTDKGQRFLELNMFPNTPFYIFEPKEKSKNNTDIELSDLSSTEIPF